MARLCSSLLLSLLFASSASAVALDLTPIGNPGNACDPQDNNGEAPAGCFGSVPYNYRIGTYEVTRGQYVEFLNAKAASDPLGLYNSQMGSNSGIARSGVSGTFSYSVVGGQVDKPITAVTFYDALRFANWMNNGQGSSDTETGSYTLLGGTTTPSNGATVTRNPGANIVLSSQDEWYKAAYYAPSTSSYFDYPTGSDTQPTCATPTATANRASCNNMGGVVNKGSYPGSASPYGTFDQGGNAYEWNEALLTSTPCFPPGTVCRGLMGGSSYTPPIYLASFARDFKDANDPFPDYSIGFRLVLIPEPSTGLLVIAGLLGLAVRRRAAD